MLDVYSPEELNALAESVPMGRLAQPEEIAAATAFLVSPEAGYISGQVLSPNGAMIIMRFIRGETGHEIVVANHGS